MGSVLYDTVVASMSTILNTELIFPPPGILYIMYILNSVIFPEFKQLCPYSGHSYCEYTELNLFSKSANALV